MTEKVSVIIPCFNNQATIADAITSALEQTHSNVEVIVIDDGSTDGSLAIVQSFGDRLRWVSSTNRGACAARNTGLKLATGKFIQFLDSDDLLLPDKISKSLAASNGDPSTVVFSLQYVVSLDPALTAREWNRTSGLEDPICFMLSGDLPTPAPLHRRDILVREGGFDESLPCAQDRELHLRLAMHGLKFQLLPEKLYTVRRRAGSIGTSAPLRIHDYRGKIALKAHQEMQENGLLTEQRRLACAAMCMHAARKLVLANPSRARELMKQAKVMHPSGGLSVVYSPRARMVRGALGPWLAERLFSAFARNAEL